MRSAGSIATPHPIGRQTFLVILSGAAIALLIGSFSTPLVGAAILGVFFCVVFLQRPDIGLLIVLGVRSSTDVILLLAKTATPGGTSVASNAAGVADSLLSPNTGLVLILIGIGGIYILNRGIRFLSLPAGTLFVLFLITGLFGMLRSQSILFSFREWLPVVSSLVVYALSAHFYNSPQKIQRVIDVLAVSYILPAFFGFKQILLGNGDIGYNIPELGEINRIFGTFVHPNPFAFYLVLILGVFTCELFAGSRWRKFRALVIVASAAVLLIRTYTRMGWVGALIALLTIGILRYRKLLVLVPITVLVVSIANPSLIGRIGDPISDPSGRSGVEDRLDIWRTTYAFWRDATQVDDSPIATAMNRLGGLGPGAIDFLTAGSATFRGFTYAAHNDYIRIMNEYGIFGLALYGLLVLVMLIFSYRSMRASAGTQLASIPLAFFAITTAYFVMSFTDNVFGSTQNQVYYWALAGLTVSVGRLHHSPRQDETRKSLSWSREQAESRAETEPGQRWKNARVRG
jgi:putative inorganic carbon (HCO3(-)) transporter